MGESVRLRMGAQRVFEAMVRDPESVWSVQSIHAHCNGSEKAVEQVIEILLSSGAGTAVVAGSPVRLDPTGGLGYDYQFRLTGDGPERLRQILEASRYSGGVIASLWFEGWEPAKVAWQARRFRRAVGGRRRQRADDRDSLMFDPGAGRGLERLLGRIRQRR